MKRGSIILMNLDIYNIYMNISNIKKSYNIKWRKYYIILAG